MKHIKPVDESYNKITVFKFAIQQTVTKEFSFSQFKTYVLNLTLKGQNFKVKQFTKKKKHSHNLLTTEGSVASELAISLRINPFKKKKN